MFPNPNPALDCDGGGTFQPLLPLLDALPPGVLFQAQKAAAKIRHKFVPPPSLLLHQRLPLGPLLQDVTGRLKHNGVRCRVPVAERYHPEQTTEASSTAPGDREGKEKRRWDSPASPARPQPHKCLGPASPACPKPHRCLEHRTNAPKKKNGVLRACGGTVGVGSTGFQMLSGHSTHSPANRGQKNIQG